MSLTRTNPLSLGVLGDISAPDVLKQVQDLWLRINSASAARQEFLKKQEKLLRQRKGIRRPKNFPWPGENNHNWPLTDAVCRRWKPGIVSLVLQADPVCYFFSKRPEGLQAAPIAQEYYTWRFTEMTDYQKTALELADYVFQYGLGYSEQGWEYRTEKSCRIVRTADIFPGGPPTALEQFNAAVRQQRAQTEQAVAAGKAPPEALQQVPQETDLETFVLRTLEDQYLLKEDNQLELQQLLEATKANIAGAEQVRFYYQVVRADKPMWKAHDPLRVIVPPRMDRLADADFIALEYMLSADDVRKMAVDGHFKPEQAEHVVAFMSNRSSGDPYRQAGVGALASSSHRMILDVLDRADGISPGMIREPDLEPIYKVYCKLDINGDKILERCILWYHFGSSDTTRDMRGTILALYPLPMPFSEWPVVDFKFEHTSDRPYSSRGGAELLSVFQATTNKIHNARLDAIQITLSPMLVMRTTAGDEAPNIRFMPGAIIPVQAVGDVAPLQMDTRPLQSLLVEENVTKQQGEQYIGVFDPGILAENAAECRTATEVDAVTQQTQSIFGQDAMLFQTSMSKVHRQLWLIDQEFGPDEIFYRVTGDQRPKLAKKHELAYDYDIVPAGTPANTNQAFARKKSLEAMQLFGQDQTGLIDKHALYLNYFNVMDRNLGKLVVRDEQAAALYQQMQALVAKMVETQGGNPKTDVAPIP